MSYDLIGDVHGCARTLEALLGRLGFALQDGVYRHPTRQAIFLGDFIDRGPHQRDVIGIVRPMVERGAALAVMANHEFNAISYATPCRNGEGYLREHSDRNVAQHEAFLAEYEFESRDHADVLAWFRTLPLWLDLDGLRVVHACWDREQVVHLAKAFGPHALLTDDVLHRAAVKGSEDYVAIETVLKGKELTLPGDMSFLDKGGVPRHEIRVRWWDARAKTYRAAFMGPESARTHIPDDDIEGDHLVEYVRGEKPCFLGHYWLEGEPAPLAPNIACLDYSVAKPGGKLVAYRWDGEQEIDQNKFVSEARCEG